MRSLALLSLLLPLSLHASLQQSPKHGARGTFLVEAKDAQGAWKEAGRLHYDFHYRAQSLDLPAAALPSGELRVTAIDNDENQLDAVRLSQGPSPLKLLSARNGGEDLLRKLSRADRDIKEVGHTPVLLRFAAPQAGTMLSFTLHARSASESEFLGYPFWVRPQQGQTQASYKLAAEEGQELSLDSGRLKPSSGHPAAPILGQFKIQGGRLKGRVDFGPDNDPGPDDYVSLLARDAQGQPHLFKVGMEPKGGRWGHSDYVYGHAASWQYMRFHFDVPLAELPRAADGGLALELLAYGTACGNLDNDAKVNYASSNPASPATGQWLTVTVNVNESSGVYANVAHPLSVTCVILDPLGATVFSQVNSISLTPGNCGYTSTPFGMTLACSGVYTIWANAVGNPDYNASNGSYSTTFTVSGACATATPSPTSSETPLPSPSSTSTPTETPSSTGTVSPTATLTATPSPSFTASASTSPTLTASPTATDTVTPTDPQLTQTVVALSNTPTPPFPISEAGGPKVGPVPVPKGQPLKLFFETQPESSSVELYNASGELVTREVFGNDAQPSLATDQIAPGLYYLMSTVDGKRRWQKVVIVP